jgi:outer membrane protein assembly factor BamB
MSANLSLERQLASVMAEEATDPARDVLLDDILATTARLRPEARWLALLKEPAMRTDSRLAVGLPTRGLILAAIVAVLVLGGIAAVVIGANLLKPPLQPAVTDDWPGFRGDATHNGVAATGPTGRPVPRWQLHADGAIASHIAVVGDTAYVASDDGVVHALTVADGTERWTYRTDGASSPTIVDGRAYLKNQAGEVVALDASNGAEVWRAGPFRGPTTLGVDDSGVYFGTELGTIVAIDRDTGHERWEARVADAPVGNPALGGGRVYAGVSDSAFVALDAATGRPAWRVDTGSGAMGTAVVANGIAYIGMSGDASTPLRAIDAATGDVLWTSDDPLQSPTVADGTAYAGSTSGLLTALDAVTGAERWRLRLGGPLRAPAVAGDVLYVVADGERRLYAIDRASGGLFWSFDLDGPSECCVAVARGTVWVGTSGGTVYAIGGDGSQLAAAPYVEPDVTPAPRDTPQPSAVASEPTTPAQPVVEHLGDLVAPGSPVLIPNTVTIAPDGRVWAADAQGNRFAIFDPDGTFVEYWGMSGKGNGEFDFSRSNGEGYGMGSFGPDGMLYVSDAGNRRIQVFNANREFVRAFGEFGAGPGQFTDLIGIAAAPDGTVVALDEVRGVVERLTADGSVVQTFDAFPNARAGSGSTNSMAVDADNNVYVSQLHPFQVTKFSPAGDVIQVFGADGPERFSEQPGFMAIDNNGRLFVSQGPSRGRQPGVKVFDPDGTYLGGWGVLDAPENDVLWPTGIALDGDGSVYVADAGNLDGLTGQVVHKFGLLPPFAP